MSSKLMIAVWSLGVLALATSCEDKLAGPPAPVSTTTAHINGRVWHNATKPLRDANVYVIYEGVPSSPPDYVASYDVAQQGWVNVSLFTANGNSVTTCVDGVQAAGRYECLINTRNLPNGAYELRVNEWTPMQDSLLVSFSRWLAVNETDPHVLAAKPPLATSDSTGTFRAEVGAGMIVELFDDTGQDMGEITLNNISLVAQTHADPQAWLTQFVVPGGSYILNLRAQIDTTLRSQLVVQVGDTLTLIPDSALAYADAHWSLDAYWLREFQLATSELYNPQPFVGTLVQWKGLAWEVRRNYLRYVGFVRDVAAADSSEHYSWIANYPHQFGFGWTDTYRANANLHDPHAGNIWAQPSDAANSPDDSTTTVFDGTSHAAEYYRSMWTVIPG